MSGINDLVARIESTFTRVKEKAKERQQQELKHFQERQKLYREYEKVQAQIVETAKPRLEALAKRAASASRLRHRCLRRRVRRGSSSGPPKPTSR